MVSGLQSGGPSSLLSRLVIPLVGVALILQLGFAPHRPRDDSRDPCA
jgi:hypothetical protein